MKECNHCHQVLEVDNFYPRNYGYFYICKLCAIKRVMNYQKTNPDKKRHQDKLYRQRHGKKITTYNKKYRKNFINWLPKAQDLQPLGEIE